MTYKDKDQFGGLLQIIYERERNLQGVPKVEKITTQTQINQQERINRSRQKYKAKAKRKNQHQGDNRHQNKLEQQGNTKPTTAYHPIEWEKEQ